MSAVSEVRSFFSVKEFESSSSLLISFQNSISCLRSKLDYGRDTVKMYDCLRDIFGDDSATWTHDSKSSFIKVLQLHLRLTVQERFIFPDQAIQATVVWCVSLTWASWRACATVLIFTLSGFLFNSLIQLPHHALKYTTVSWQLVFLSAVCKSFLVFDSAVPGILMLLQTVWWRNLDLKLPKALQPIFRFQIHHHIWLQSER